MQKNLPSQPSAQDFLQAFDSAPESASAVPEYVLRVGDENCRNNNNKSNCHH